MKYLFLFVSLLSSLHLRSQKQVTINVTVTGIKDGTKVFLVPENGDTWRDSTIVNNSSFIFQRKLSAATEYSIRLTREPGDGKWQTFYVDKGIINIHTTSDNFYNTTISGSKFAEDLNKYNTYLRKQNANRPLIARSYEEFKQLDSMKAIWSKQWVKSHLNSPISAYLLYSNRRITFQEKEEIFRRLPNVAKENIYWKYLKSYIEAPKKIALGKFAPLFSQQDTSSKWVALKDFRGKFILLDFWASWCEPCREENPFLVKAINKYKDKPFSILSVSLDNNRTHWINAIQKDGLTWTQVSDLKFWNNAVAKQYAIEGVPSNFLLDPQGRIIAINLRGAALEKKLADLFEYD